MKFRSTLLLSLFLCVSFNLFAQHRDCGAMQYLEQQILDNPERGANLEAIEKHTAQWLANPANQVEAGELVTIPVVFHVVYNTTSENISTAQVNSQLQVLNDDFRRLNSDANGTWSQAADTEIEFCLATVDPSGNTTDGITRTSTSVTAFGTNDEVKFNSSGGIDAWPAADYLNFWVCDISGGILGYAQFPGGPAATDGVVCDYQYTGTIGTATSPFDLGRTATHEVGHWLNLRHIWGDGGCTVDDFVADTPSSDAANYGCATGHSSCGTTDMVENYMDYSDDACMNLFTAGQTTRMQALFGAGGSKASLLTSGGCGSGTAPTCNDGVQNGNETGIDCGGSCAACPTGCSDNLVNISITLDNYPAETSWTITNASGAVVASGGTYAGAASGSTISVDECLVNGCYDFTINDTYGDGICCSYGNGSYTVSSGGSTLASGGAFGSTEVTNFCFGGSGPILGCTDSSAHNYNPAATQDDGSCETCGDNTQNGDETGVDCGGSLCGPCAILGCTDSGAHNYNPAATQNDGSCETCGDNTQNGDETGVDCGGSLCGPCAILGCTDSSAHNYNPSATQNDGSCETCSDNVQNGDETGVDCGGALCSPCSSGCSTNLVNVSITLDNYPAETTWTITNASGAVIASGGSYSTAGSTVSVDECLADGCYDFTINDSYGDGICCSYGNGSYTVSSGGTTLANGGAFGSSEVTNFCFGGSGPILGCTDSGAHNYNTAATQDDGSCEDCSDGTQNGDETGVDCGGALCSPCNTGGSTVLSSHYFESGWDGWADGGSDCFRYSGTRSYEGTRSIRIRDNSGTVSAMTSSNYNLASYSQVEVEFSFYANSMENNEDFWLRYYNGSSWSTIQSWARGTDFDNNTFYTTTVTIDNGTYNFPSNAQFRFQCDASANADQVYIDAVVITATGNATKINTGTTMEITALKSLSEGFRFNESDIAVYPNPSSTSITVRGEDLNEITVLSLDGSVIYQRACPTEGMQIDISSLPNGLYMIQATGDEEQYYSKLIKQ